MKASDVRAKTQDQLSDDLANLKKEQFNLRFQKATGQLEKTARVRQVRRDIARIKTIAAEKAAGRGWQAEAAFFCSPTPNRANRPDDPLLDNPAVLLELGHVRVQWEGG